MTVSDQDLEEALGIAAKIIDLYGYTYWPIFERLETELEGRHIRRQKVEARLRKKRSSQQHIAYKRLDFPGEPQA